MYASAHVRLSKRGLDFEFQTNSMYGDSKFHKLDSGFQGLNSGLHQLKFPGFRIPAYLIWADTPSHCKSCTVQTCSKQTRLGEGVFVSQINIKMGIPEGNK